MPLIFISLFSVVIVPGLIVLALRVTELLSKPDILPVLLIALEVSRVTGSKNSTSPRILISPVAVSEPIIILLKPSLKLAISLVVKSKAALALLSPPRAIF